MRISSILAVVLGFFILFFYAQPIAPQLTEGIPTHVAFIWLIFLLFAVLWQKVFIVVTKLTPAILFALATPILILLYQSIISNVVISLAQIVTGIIIAIMVSSIWINCEARNHFFKIVLLGAIASAVVSLIQFFNIHPFVWSWTEYELFVYGTAGLEKNPVPFGYSIVAITSVITCATIMLYQKKYFLPISKAYLIFSALLLGVAIALSGARSAIMGVAIAALWFFLYSKKPLVGIEKVLTCRTYNFSQVHVENNAMRRRKSGSGTAIIAVIIILALVLALKSTREGIDFQDPRFIANWKVYLPLILRSPFAPSEIESYLYLVDQDSLWLLMNEGKRAQPNAPHNIILTTGIFYGVPGIISIVTVYLLTMRKAYQISREALKYNMCKEQLWLLALIAANIGVVCHSWFHNANIFMGEMRNWVWIGALWGMSYYVKVQLLKNRVS